MLDQYPQHVVDPSTLKIELVIIVQRYGRQPSARDQVDKVDVLVASVVSTVRECDQPFFGVEHWLTTHREDGRRCPCRFDLKSEHRVLAFIDITPMQHQKAFCIRHSCLPRWSSRGAVSTDE